MVSVPINDHTVLASRQHAPYYFDLVSELLCVTRNRTSNSMHRSMIALSSVLAATSASAGATASASSVGIGGDIESSASIVARVATVRSCSATVTAVSCSPGIAAD